MVVTELSQMDRTISTADVLAALTLVSAASQVHSAVATAPLLRAVVVVSQLGHRHLAVGRAPFHVAVSVVPSTEWLVSARHRLGSISSSLLLPLLLSSCPLLQAPPVFLLLLTLSCLFLSL